MWLQTPWWTQSLPGHIVSVLLQWQTVVQNQTPNKFWSNPITYFPDTPFLLQETLPYCLTNILGWMALDCHSQPREVNPVPAWLSRSQARWVLSDDWTFLKSPSKLEIWALLSLAKRRQKKPAQYFPIRSRQINLLRVWSVFQSFYFFTQKVSGQHSQSAKSIKAPFRARSSRHSVGQRERMQWYKELPEVLRGTL